MKVPVQTLWRFGVAAVTLFVMVAMSYVPPWLEYQVHLRDPLPYVTEYKWLPTYSWYDQPPSSRGQGHGYAYFQSLLWLQWIAVGWAGAAAAFGKRGMFVYGLTAAGFFLGGYFPRLIIPPAKPHAGWDSPLILVIMAVTGLIGAGTGLALGLGIVKALSPLPTHRRDVVRGDQRPESRRRR